MKVQRINGELVELEDDWGAQAQREVERHLEACWDWYYADEEGLEVGDFPGVTMFCGGTNCSRTCEVNEMLAAALPFITAGVLRDHGVVPG